MSALGTGCRRARRRTDRGHVSAALHAVGRTSAITCGDTLVGTGRYRLYGTEAPTGGVVTVDSRPVSWEWDVGAELGRLQRCEAAWGLLRLEGRWVTRRWPCGSRLCPVCWADRAGSAAHTWAPVLEAAIASGYRAWHVVLTQRCEPVYGSALADPERGRWRGRGLPPAGVEVPAIAGESCLASYRRWYAAWRRLHTSRYGRTLWAGTGTLRGTEWTLASRSSGRVPRWHCHGHVLVVAPPTWEPAAVLAEWSRQQGGRTDVWHRPSRRSDEPVRALPGQWAELVPDASGVVEVLKYPYKPGRLTRYGMIDAWAALRGTRTHQVAGGLHGQSRLASSAPWAEWLAARPDPRRASLVQRGCGDAWRPLLLADEVLDGSRRVLWDPHERWRWRDGEAWREAPAGDPAVLRAWRAERDAHPDSELAVLASSPSPSEPSELVSDGEP